MNQIIIDKLIQRAGVFHPNKKAASKIITAWARLGPGAFDLYAYEPKSEIEEILIDRLKLECRLAADIVARSKMSPTAGHTIRDLFTAPELCEHAIRRLEKMAEPKHCANEIRKRYVKRITCKKRIYIDKYIKETVDRHIRMERLKPGHYTSKDNPYARTLNEIIKDIDSVSSGDEEDDDDDIVPTIDL